MYPASLKGKKIILGVTGCIAAYKSAYIVRSLISLGAEVKVVMTSSASKFITPYTLSVLSKNNVITDIFPQSTEGGNLSTWHVDYALWADLMLIAPCTVNTISKIASGIADNAVTTLALALRCPLILSPAADVDMYENQIIQKNFKLLEEAGYFIVSAGEGELASGLIGKGRLPEIDKIIKAVQLVLLGYKKDLTGKNILVTAGGTLEDIDPVRYIGNRSSGKMGYEIAKSAVLRGAKVTLISAPSNEEKFDEMNFIKIRSVHDMYNAVKENIDKNDFLVMAAAAADYKPKNVAKKKIKKETNFSSIELDKTIDILSTLDKGNCKVAGFALETDNELENAKSKLKRKNLDLIVLNSLNDKNSGFEFDTNTITIITKSGEIYSHPLMTKFEAANVILDQLIKL